MEFPKRYPHFYSVQKSQLLPYLLYWAEKEFEFFAYFEGNGCDYLHGPFENRFFAGNIAVKPDELWDSNQLEKVGIIGYDYKNQLEKLSSQNPSLLELEDISFFYPEICIQFSESSIYSKKPLARSLLDHILSTDILSGPVACDIVPLIDKQEYLRHVRRIQDEIREGNTYETNFCQAYWGQFDTWDPIAAFLKLNELSRMPFAGLFKAGRQWLVSASPERFLKRHGKQLIAQPVKGTIRRGKTVREDKYNRQKLLGSEKERAENLMITDLMRNDLARVSLTGSVQVEELFGIHALPGVFQMVSTVTSQLRPGTGFADIIRAAFPMGSMTGAPKISTMELIDQEENFRRAWFSGAYGWIDEQGDFDFSVIIRSIVSDSQAKKLYFGVGSAITADSYPEQEYEECVLKTQAIRKLLSGD